MEMLMHTSINDIQDVFLRGVTDEVTSTLATEHPADLADALQKLDPASAWKILRQMTRPRQAATFGYLDPDFQTLLATVTPRSDLAAIVTSMKADERADLYKKLSD